MQSKKQTPEGYDFYKDDIKLTVHYRNGQQKTFNSANRFAVYTIPFRTTGGDPVKACAYLSTIHINSTESQQVIRISEAETKKETWDIIYVESAEPPDAPGFFFYLD